MNKYDLIGRMNSCFNQLEQSLAAFCHQLEGLPLLAAEVFGLPEIEKGKEHDPVAAIAVEQHSGEAAFGLAIQQFQRLFIHQQGQNISSKAALRLPGVICLATDLAQYRQLDAQIRQINQLKSQLEQIVAVESGLPPEQRFEFVHNQLQGLITLNAYRALTALLNPDSVRFGWANKHIIKNMQRDEVLKQLEKSLKAGRSVAPYTREQWAERVSDEIALLQQLPVDAQLKIKRPVKVQPIARVWYQEQQKQVQYACPVPLIAFCLPTDPLTLPKLGLLPDYDANNITHKHKPRAQTLRLVIPRLHLYLLEGE